MFICWEMTNLPRVIVRSIYFSVGFCCWLEDLSLAFHHKFDLRLFAHCCKDPFQLDIQSHSFIRCSKVSHLLPIFFVDLKFVKVLQWFYFLTAKRKSCLFYSSFAWVYFKHWLYSWVWFSDVYFFRINQGEVHLEV